MGRKSSISLALVRPAMFPLRSEADVNNRFKKDECFEYERARGKLIDKRLKGGEKMDISLLRLQTKICKKGNTCSAS